MRQTVEYHGYQNDVLQVKVFRHAPPSQPGRRWLVRAGAAQQGFPTKESALGYAKQRYPACVWRKVTRASA